VTDERTVRQRLEDARQFARRAHDLASEVPLSMLKTIDYYEHAVRSYLIIVGEALNPLPDDMKAAHPQIDWHMIRGMRNRLVHAYWRVDLEIVYRAAREHAPLLSAQINELIETIE
jgi:uncharacterized protein with HEPN domain